MTAKACKGKGMGIVQVHEEKIQLNKKKVLDSVTVVWHASGRMETLRLVVARLPQLIPHVTTKID